MQLCIRREGAAQAFLADEHLAPDAGVNREQQQQTGKLPGASVGNSEGGGGRAVSARQTQQGRQADSRCEQLVLPGRAGRDQGHVGGQQDTRHLRRIDGVAFQLFADIGRGRSSKLGRRGEHDKAHGIGRKLVKLNAGGDKTAPLGRVEAIGEGNDSQPGRIGATGQRRVAPGTHGGQVKQRRQCAGGIERHQFTAGFGARQVNAEFAQTDCERTGVAIGFAAGFCLRPAQA